MIGIYVDDLLIVGNARSAVDDVRRQASATGSTFRQVDHVLEDTSSDSPVEADDMIAPLEPVVDHPPDNRRTSTRRRVNPLPFRAEFGYSARIQNCSTGSTQVQPFEPTTYNEAVTRNDADLWKAAMQSEYDSLVGNQTWELVDHKQEVDRRRKEGKPPIKLIGVRWVFKRTLDSEG